MKDSKMYQHQQEAYTHKILYKYHILFCGLKKKREKTHIYIKNKGGKEKKLEKEESATMRFRGKDENAVA